MAEQPKPRGGAAREIRTGRFIREWLEKIEESSIAEIHGALKSEIGRRNMLRPRSKWLKAPTYPSFYRYFAHVRRWGLVEFVREGPTEFVAHDRLLSFHLVEPWPETGLPESEVGRSTRRFYRLSEFGRRPEIAFLWDDPLMRGVLRRALLGGGPGQP